MARRYDSSTTTFSPEGRLHQVEYAIEAINNAGTCIGILASDGIVMASERRLTSGLLAPGKVRTESFATQNASWLVKFRGGCSDLVNGIPFLKSSYIAHSPLPCVCLHLLYSLLSHPPPSHSY